MDNSRAGASLDPVDVDARCDQRRTNTAGVHGNRYPGVQYCGGASRIAVVNSSMTVEPNGVGCCTRAQREVARADGHHCTLQLHVVLRRSTSVHVNMHGDERASLGL